VGGGVETGMISLYVEVADHYNLDVNIVFAVYGVDYLYGGYVL
jgi:hypothetical protein